MYEVYYRELYLYVYSICGNKNMTEDVLQETFLKALLALKDSHTNMRAWLYLTARNFCYNLLTREKRLVYGEETGRADEGAEDLLEQILKKEQSRRLQSALDRLSKPQREVLMLQYFGGFRQREIAAMMKLTPANVRVLAHRAKKELKSILEVREDDL